MNIRHIRNIFSHKIVWLYRALHDFYMNCNSRIVFLNDQLQPEIINFNNC